MTNINTNTKLVWKGRMIVGQDGRVDLPPDRQGVSGPEDAKARMHFLARLNDVIPQRTMFEIIREKLKSREIKTREAANVVLFDGVHEGERWLIEGNSNASYGYFYVTARCLGRVTTYSIFDSNNSFHEGGLAEQQLRFRLRKLGYGFDDSWEIDEIINQLTKDEALGIEED